ncbi:LPXTG cell wall anchor domain-containing protein [Ligilactobacillus agilis]|nr:LPXTG cell wall anchor domain-containing protein [Ligilactobacillus agilis]
MSKATLPLQEQKVRHKMYKTHKGWMVAGMATVSMALPMVVMTTKASADSVPVPTNSSVTTPTTDSTAVTTATGTAQNGNGQNVEVPHQNLDSAVNQANQTGVRVTQNQTTSQTVTADQSQQAQTNIANDYNQQTQKLNEATKAQDWKNTTYKSDQADANQVNANNQAKINQAVQNARQEGVNAYHDTANDTTQTANIGRYDNSDYEAKKQDVNQKTNETVAKLNEVTAKAHANNTVTNASNDHSTLDQTVQDARSKGFTVNQEATRNVGEVTTANANQLANSIRQDYQNQNDALTLAISQYYAKAQQNLGTTDVEGFLHSLWEARRSYAVNHGNVGMTGSGSWTNFAIDNYDGMIITPRGTVHSLNDLKNGNYQIIVEHADSAKVVKYVEWGNVTPQLISGELNAGIGRDNQGDYDKYPTQKDNGTRTQTWNVTPGTKFRIPGAVHMANGDVKDLIVTVRQSGNKLNSNHITVYNQDGAVNFSNVANGYNNNNRIDLEFWINNENDHTDYLWVTTIADIDVKQKFSYGSTQIIGLGGLVSVHDGVIQGSDGADLNGPSSAPNGMAILALHENHFWMALQDDGGSAYYPMIAVFGRAGNVEPTIIPDKPTLAYHYDSIRPIFVPSRVSYTTASLAVNTPTPETANYTLHNLTVTTQTEKGATQVNDNSDVIADGHKLLAGDALTYNIDVKDNSLPANRTDDTTSFTFTDTLPSAFTLDSYSISNGNDGGDVTQLFNYIYDPATRKFTATAKKPLLDLMNQDKTKAYILPSLHLNGRVNASGATLRNQADVLINGVKASTNVVTNTSTNSNPSKSVSVGGQDANGKTTITNDVQNFDVTFDLTDYANTTASDAIKSRGIKFTDDMTITNNAVSLNQGSIKLVDAHGNSVGGYTLNVNPTNSGYQLVVNVNNAKDFLNTYGGQKLHLQYTAKTNDGVTGSVRNVATENIYGSTYTTNTVITNVKDINPTKDIVVNAGDSRSIDGNTVPINSTYNYKLNSSELPASRVSVITNWGISDNIDTNHVQLTGAWKVVNNHGFTDEQGNIINAGTDITSYFDYHVGDNGNIQITPKASFLALMNKAENKTFEKSWSAYVQVKVIKAGWVTNTFNENLNDDYDRSNEVKTFSFDPVTPDPDKNGTIGKSDSVTYISVNNKKVTKGDTVSYVLKGQDLKQYHEVINQFEATDTFDNGLSYIGYKAYLNNKDGSRVDVTSHMTQRVNGQQVTWVADAQLIKMLNSDDYNTKPGVAPTIYAFAKVLTDNNEAINNTYELNINGKTKLSQNIKIVPTTSTLDKNESVAGKDSNGKTVITNDLINFTLPWDLTNLNPQTTDISAEQMAKGLSVTDKMTTTVPSLTPFNQGTKVSISDASGHAVDSNLYTINYDSDGLGFNVQVKDVARFLQAYGGQRLNLTYSITTPDGVSGTFNNQATQNEFGNITKTKVVQNNVKDINPTKDVVVNAGQNISIDGETVDYNSNINYKLNSSELPANRATVVTNWSTTDGLDTRHVDPTGNWHVYTNTDFVDNQGNTIKANTDISRYFNYNYVSTP